MENPLSILHSALKQPPKSWRDALRARLGKNGEKLHEILADLAEGKATFVTLPNGQFSEPVLPTPDVRLRAAMFLQEQLYGRAVPQTHVSLAEQEAQEMAAVKALDDDALEKEAARILAARATLQPTNPVVDTDFKPTLDPSIEEFARLTWEATVDVDHEIQYPPSDET